MNNLDSVTFIYDDGTEEVKEDMQLDVCYKSGDEWFLCLSEMSEEDKKKKALEDELTDIQIAIAEVYEMLL